MDNIIRDAALNADLQPAEQASQGQEALPTEQRQQQKVSHLDPPDRAARVETLRQRVATGTYHVDSTDLAICILRNATRFVETC